MADTKISALTAATTPLDGTEVLPIVQSSTTKKVANNDLRPKQIQSNATSGVLQVAGPAAASTRVMTVPDANFIAARTDAGQTFSGLQNFSFTGGNGPVVNRTDGSGYINFQTTGTNNAQIGEDGAAGFVIYTNLATSAKQAFRCTSAGNVLLPVGNLVPATAAKGVDFSANTPAAGMTSQLLNWYEEGTWTPTLYGTGGSAGTYAATASGTYTRVGRLVHVMGSVSISNKGSWSGTVQVDAPFTPSGQSGTGAVRSQLNTFDGTLVCEWSTSGSALRFNVTKTGTGQVTLQWTDLVTSGYLQFSLTYFV